MKRQLHSKKKKSSLKPRQALGKSDKDSLSRNKPSWRGEGWSWWRDWEQTIFIFRTCPQMVTRTGPFLPRMERGTPRRARFWRRKMEDFGRFGAVQWQLVFCSFLEQSNDNIFGTVPVGNRRDVRIDFSAISLTCSCKRWCCDVFLDVMLLSVPVGSEYKQPYPWLNSLGLTWTLFSDITLDSSVLNIDGLSGRIWWFIFIWIFHVHQLSKRLSGT